MGCPNRRPNPRPRKLKKGRYLYLDRYEIRCVKSRQAWEAVDLDTGEGAARGRTRAECLAELECSLKGMERDREIER